MAIQNAPMIMNIVTTALTQFSTTLFQNLPTIVQTIFTFLTSAVDSLIPQIPIILHSVVQGILDTFVKLTDPTNLQKLFDSAIQLVTSLANGIVNEISSPDFWDKVTKIITSIFEILLSPDNLGKMIEAGIQLTIALGKGLIYGIPHLIDAVGEVASDIATKAVQGVKDIWVNIKGALTGQEKEEMDRQKANNKVWNNLEQQLWNETGHSINNGLFSGIKESEGQVTNEMNNLAEETKSSFKNPLSIFSPSKVFEGFGDNIIQGLINGLWNKAGQLFNTIKNIASNVINNMKSALGIHSPSKEFAELGMYSAEGYEIGFMKQLPQLEKEMQTGINDLVEGSFMMSPKLNQSINPTAKQEKAKL
jgi:phage-related protein